MLNVKSKNLRNGSLLIESIVGISIAITGMIGIFGLLSRSLAINKDLTQKFIATYLSAEGVEVVKSLIDSNVANGNIWNAGLSAGNYELSYDSLALFSSVTGQSTTPLLFDESSGAYNYLDGRVTPFKRTIKISEPSSDEMKIVSDVEWAERSLNKKVSLEDHFFNWR